MKKLIFLCAILSVAIALTSFKRQAAPKLYPELEIYFKSVERKEFSTDHLHALENLKSDINLSHLDYDDWNLIFYCSENTFRSQASQVFAQTLCYEKRHKKMKIFSAGLSSGEISPKLIEYLSRIGYKITKSENKGKTMYEAKFSEQADPVVLFSKTTADKSLPTKDVTSVIVCDVKNESDCATLKTESNPLNLAFPKVVATDASDKIETTLKSIAAEMIYVTKK
jgi:arsenate reductase (thioredoxin)